MGYQEEEVMSKRSRQEAFCAPEGPEVFHAVASRHEIWKEDPFDVVSIHAGARATFERLLHRATTPPGLDAGRLLLLLGESGCGKTHLMRAFRNYVHGQKCGYVGYLQMTSSTANYGAYVLSNLIDSLDKPYFASLSNISGLMRLSNALAEDTRLVPPEMLEQLREADGDALGLLVYELADHIVMDERFGDVDLEILRAFLYLQREDPRIKGRVLRYLRCEGLSDADRAMLGGIVPRVREDDPQRVAEQLGRLVWKLEEASLVLCVDQLEDIYNLDESETKFRRAMATLCGLADQVPSSIVVISCLEDYYTELKARLTRSMLDRIEVNPEPVTLESQRTGEEIEHLVAQRLAVLYDTLEAPYDDADAVFPFSRQSLHRLAGMRTRDVLRWCRRYREQCVRAGRLVEPTEPEGEVIAVPQTQHDRVDIGNFEAVITTEQLWNDFQSGQAFPPPEDDADLLALLGWAIEVCSTQGVDGYTFEARSNDTTIDVDIRVGSECVEALAVGLCNKDARGGHLGRQVESVTSTATRRERLPVIARSTDFPKNPKTKIAQQIADLITAGGRRVVVEDSDWRAMLAFRTFQAQRGASADFATWFASEKPLARLPSLRQILDLDARPPASHPSAMQASGTTPATIEPPREHIPSVERGTTEEPTAARADATESAAIEVGHTADLTQSAVRFEPDDLTRHAAFLGGTGSGKTTLALHIVEQLALRGIPAILVDRKGDLVNYASEARSEDNARGARLRQRLDVALYTPPHPQGRPLSISIVPHDLAQAAPLERERIAGFSAFSLGSMLGYKPQTPRDKTCIAILATAIRVFTEHVKDEALTLDRLIDFIDARDASLVGELGRLDGKLFSRLVQDLETLRLINGSLFARDQERLDIDRLLGTGPYAVSGRTRLSIVSTKFLGDNANVCFWVAQLLAELGRWISRRPADRLQAVVLFDEADLYLPAQRRPPTKEPMEHLLRRARSGGLGVLLATQSPGDLDYKCRDNIRTWFVGRVRERTALHKMKPMLSEARMDVSGRLPAQGPGEFFMIRERDTRPIRAHKNLVPAQQRSEEEILTAAAQAAPVRR
jgi:energy-coupling factor transporter ATP-binding protein EcfA2